MPKSPLFAYDFTMSEFSTDFKVIEECLQCDVDILLEWADEHDLKIEPSKLKILIYTTWTKQVMINGIPIPVDEFNKILGDIFDKMNCFAEHLDSVIVWCQQRLQILKVLAG